MRLVFLRSAEEDIKALKGYIVKNFGRESWTISYEKLKACATTLQEHPRMGRIPPELEQLDITQYRQVISGMNRIIYEVREETIYIHVVVDTRRDLQRLLMKRIVRP